MKHLYLAAKWLIVGLLVFSFTTGVALADNYFSDNFNDGNADGWTVGGGNVWTVLNGEYRAGNTGLHDASIYSSVTLPSVFAYGLDVSFIGDANFYVGGAVFSSTSVGGAMDDKWVMACVYTHPSFPNDIKVVIMSYDGGYWESAATPRSQTDVYRLMVERTAGTNYLKLTATGGASPITVQCDDIGYINDLQYAGLINYQGSGWIGYDNVALTPSVELGTIFGEIELQDISPSADISLSPIKIQLTPTSGGAARTEEVRLTSNPGAYSISDVITGEYNISFLANSWVANVQTAVPVTTGSTTFVNASLLNGDVDADGVVTTTDLSVVLKNLDQTAP